MEQDGAAAEIRSQLQLFFTVFFINTPEFVLLLAKQKHEWLLYCISDKVAAPGVFAVVLNLTCCNHGNHWCCQIDQDRNPEDYNFKSFV